MPTTVKDAQPAYYDDLSATLGEAWRLLVRAAADRRAPMHTPAIATIGVDGQPQVRTVVLRHADPIGRTMRFHTDIRSRKVSDILKQPNIQMLGYDPGQKVQLRVRGHATIHTGDDVALEAWRRSQPQSQLCYRQELAPGASSRQHADLTTAAEHDGQQNFAAVKVQIEEIDWLYLAATGHRRARFVWSGDSVCNVPEACWLAP